MLRPNALPHKKLWHPALQLLLNALVWHAVKVLAMVQSALVRLAHRVERNVDDAVNRVWRWHVLDLITSLIHATRRVNVLHPHL